jgi:hypothetical protein
MKIKIEIKPVVEWKPKDFVNYFAWKFEEVYGVPYDIVNMATSTIIMKELMMCFGKSMLGSQDVKDYIDNQILKCKSKRKFVSIRYLRGDSMTEFIYKKKRKVIVPIEIDSSTDDESWNRVIRGKTK